MSKSSHIETFSEPLSTRPPRRIRHHVTTHIKKYHRHWLLAGSIAAVGLLGCTATAFYATHALPGTRVAGIDVSNKTYSQIRAIALQQRNTIRVTFAYKAHKVVANASNLGIIVDPEKTARDAMSIGKSGNISQNLVFWRTKTVPLAMTNDPGVFLEFVQQEFPDVSKNPVDAQLVYNSGTNQFDIQSGVPGQGFDLKKFEAALPDIATNLASLTLGISTKPVTPTIPAANLVSLQTNVNKDIQTPISFSYNGSTIYTVKPADIASWANFTPDPSKSNSAVTYDKAKIKQFLTQKVATSIAAPAITQKVLTNPDTGQQTIIQKGQNGQSLQDIDQLTDAVYTAVTNNQTLATAVNVQTTPFNTVSVADSDHWIEVDLSRQTATLWAGNTAVATYVIASGVAAHPTEIGTFHVWYKTPSQTMTGGDLASGDYYYLPNVTWVSYFDGQEAFHTAYWLRPSQFGRPESHGCINMTYDAAKTVYDFAPIGTMVVVHT